MPNTPVTLYIDLSKECKTSLVRSDNYNAPQQLTTFVVGDVVPFELVLVKNGAVDPLSGDTTNNIEVAFGDQTSGELAYSNAWGNSSDRFSGSVAFNSTALLAALGTRPYVKTQCVIRLTSPTLSPPTIQTLAEANCTILNSVLSLSGSALTSSQYYNISASDARYLQISAYNNATGSVQGGHGIIVTNLNKVHAVTSASYTFGGIPFANSTSSLTMSHILNYDDGVLNLEGTLSSSGITSEYIFANNAYINTMSIGYSDFTASYSNRSLKADYFTLGAKNAADQTILLISSSAPQAYTTASLKGKLMVWGDPQVISSRPRVEFRSTSTDEPIATIQLDGNATNNIFLHLSASLSAGTESLKRFLLDCALSASLLEAATTKTNLVQTKTGDTLTLQASGSNTFAIQWNQILMGANASPVINALLTVSGSVCPNDTSRHDIGSGLAKWHNVYADNFIGTASLCNNALTASSFNGTGTLSGSSIQTPFFLTGKKLINLNSSSWTTGFTITVPNNESCYFEAQILGSWTNYAASLYHTHGGIIHGDGSDAGGAPGVIFQEFNKQKTSNQKIQAQILDPGMIAGNVSYPIQFIITGSAGNTAFNNATLIYEVKGNFISVV